MFQCLELKGKYEVASGPLCSQGKQGSLLPRVPPALLGPSNPTHPSWGSNTHHKGPRITLGSQGDYTRRPWDTKRFT